MPRPDRTPARAERAAKVASIQKANKSQERRRGALIWGAAALVVPSERLRSLAVFVVAMQAAMVAVGVYGVHALQSVRIAIARLLVAVAFGILLLSLLFFLVPPVSFWRSSLIGSVTGCCWGVCLSCASSMAVPWSSTAASPQRTRNRSSHRSRHR